MSEQIREQVSAFLDGELPDSETELLLKRLTRDGELRESFGRYSLIGEALRGASSDRVTKGFAAGVNLAIDGEPVHVAVHARELRTTNWWRPLAGVGIAAGVATVAIVALQQRAITPTLTRGRPGHGAECGYAQVQPRGVRRSPTPCRRHRRIRGYGRRMPAWPTTYSRTASTPQGWVSAACWPTCSLKMTSRQPPPVSGPRRRCETPTPALLHEPIADYSRRLVGSLHHCGRATRGAATAGFLRR